MIRIDGQSYDVGVISLKRTADFLDSEATERLENGDIYRDLIGVYFNYELKLEPSQNNTAYNRLWEKLTEPVEFHTVTVPYGNGDYTFVAYFAGVSDELAMMANGVNTWKGLTVKFKAKTPARS